MITIKLLIGKNCMTLKLEIFITVMTPPVKNHLMLSTPLLKGKAFLHLRHSLWSLRFEKKAMMIK